MRGCHCGSGRHFAAAEAGGSQWNLVSNACQGRFPPVALSRSGNRRTAGYDAANWRESTAIEPWHMASSYPGLIEKGTSSMACVGYCVGLTLDRRRVTGSARPFLRYIRADSDSQKDAEFARVAAFRRPESDDNEGRTSKAGTSSEGFCGCLLCSGPTAPSMRTDANSIGGFPNAQFVFHGFSNLSTFLL
jgi:hypothetical protein